MKPTVIVTSMDCQYIMEDEKYHYIIDNLGKPLPLAAIFWNEKGDLNHFAVHYGTRTICIFNTNKAKGVFWNGVEFQFGKTQMHTHIQRKRNKNVL